MFSGISRTLWISALVTMMVSSVAYAQDQNTAEFKERMVNAAVMAKQDLDEALRQYLEIHTQFSGPEIDYSLGRTYQKLGQCQESLDYYSKIMSDVSSDNPIFMRTVSSYDEVASCESWQKFMLKCDMPQGSYIMIDNERLQSCWSRPISLPDGEHTFKLVSADGKEVSQKIVAKSEAPETTVKLAFEQEKVEVVKNETEVLEKTYILKDKYHPALYWGLIAGGVAVMGAGGAFFGMANQSYADEIKYADQYTMTGNTDYLQKTRNARDDVRVYQIIAGTLLGVGGAAAVTGAVLAVINALSEKEKVEAGNDFTATIVPAKDGMSLGVQWRF